MKEYVLTVRPDENAPGQGEPIKLFEVGVDVPIAVHAAEFDRAPFVHDGQQIDTTDCLTTPGLRNPAHNEFVGEELWRRLTPGEIGVQLAPHVASSIIYLDLPARILTYPWELLRHENYWLFNSSRTCLGRAEPVPTEVRSSPPPDSDHPLRVLVVLGNHPNDPNIRAEEELVAIEAAAHAKNDEVLLRTLLRPSSEDIKNALSEFRPHVFHFIGHGERDPLDEQPQVQVFGSKAKAYDPWRADRIRTVFSSSPPRLVVLNACLSGGAPTESTSLVNAFLQAGCLAVIAMMGEIRADASESFSRNFYTELFAGKPVDLAVATARSALANLADGEGPAPDVAALRSNWVLPRLTVAGNVGTAVVMTKSAPGAVVRWIKSDFVVRWDERWNICRSMDGSVSRLALVTGGRGMGKSELLNTVAAICARHGERVLMVDVSGPKTGNSWRGVLTAIADTAAAEKLPAKTLKEIAKERGQSGLVIEKFQAGLANLLNEESSVLNEDSSLLVVLDGLSEWEPNIVKETLLPQLCGPYLRRTAPERVRMVVTMREDDEGFWPGRPEGWRPIMVGPFGADEWKRAISHFKAHWASCVPEKERDGFISLASAVAQYGDKTGTDLQYIRGKAQRPREG